jgi:Protein of unknown function (DUF2568)
VKAVNAGLAFLLELAALVALAYWGFTLDAGTVARVALGLGAPAAMVVVWGRWLAPRSPRRPAMPWLVVAKLVVFALAAAALAAAGLGVLALVFAALAVLHLVLAVAVNQV